MNSKTIFIVAAVLIAFAPSFDAQGAEGQACKCIAAAGKYLTETSLSTACLAATRVNVFHSNCQANCDDPLNLDGVTDVIVDCNNGLTCCITGVIRG